jgi:hypothetical protein
MLGELRELPEIVEATLNHVRSAADLPRPTTAAATARTLAQLCNSWLDSLDGIKAGAGKWCR